MAHLHDNEHAVLTRHLSPAYPGGVNYGGNASSPVQPMCANMDNTGAPYGSAFQAIGVNFSAFAAPPSGASPPQASTLCNTAAMLAINVPYGNQGEVQPGRVDTPPPPTPPKRDLSLHGVSIEDQSAESPWNPLARDSPGKRMLRERRASGGPYQLVNETR
jgi:hypothetical protein